MFSLLEHFDQTVEEGGQPEEPFEEGCEHDTAHDGDIDNLPSASAFVLYTQAVSSHIRL